LKNKELYEKGKALLKVENSPQEKSKALQMIKDSGYTGKKGGL